MRFRHHGNGIVLKMYQVVDSIPGSCSDKFQMPSLSWYGAWKQNWRLRKRKGLGVKELASIIPVEKMEQCDDISHFTDLTSDLT